MMKFDEIYQTVKNVREGYRNLEVEVDPSYKSNITNRVFLKDCYHKSWQYMLSHDIENMVLIHGDFTKFGLKAGHAWVEIGNVLFDGVYQRFYDKDLYYKERELTKSFEYTKLQAVNLVRYLGHYGPWDSWEIIEKMKEGKDEEIALSEIFAILPNTLH